MGDTFGCTITAHYVFKAEGTYGNVLSSAIKCSAVTLYPYSSTRGIKWDVTVIIRPFARLLGRCGAYPVTLSAILADILFF